jgi:tRNA(fMet)-specific endonuclease VapC
VAEGLAAGPQDSETSGETVAIILDTDVIIQGERKAFDLKRWVASQPSEQFEIAAITVAELWHGVERATRAFKAEREGYLGRILSLVRILPYTETTALEHARVWADLESSGKMIGFYDLIVAATALEHGSTVATFNRRHFESVRGLKVIEPK